MFDLDPSKLIVIGVVALIVIPSKDLPRVLRTLGQTSARLRRMAREFQDQFSDALREQISDAIEGKSFGNDQEKEKQHIKKPAEDGGE